MQSLTTLFKILKLVNTSIQNMTETTKSKRLRCHRSPQHDIYQNRL